MERTVRWHDYLTVNAYWFALTTRAQVLSPLIVPVLVQRFVGEAAKGSAYGTIRLWALMAAVLVQATMGMLSDRSRLRWGRRRPFILIGTLGGLVVMTLIGLSTGLEGMTGYWALFVLYILSMLASDTAHAATQGLIPDLIPEDRRGVFSGVKALLELPVPLIFVSFVVAKQVAAGELWGALLALMGVQLVCMLITMFVREEPLRTAPPPLDRSAIWRLVLMTGVFATIILGTGAAVSGMVRLSREMAPAQATLISGGIGFAGMAAAIGIGVWASVRIGVGSEIGENPSFVWWVVNRLAFLAAANGLSGFMLYFLQERFGMVGERAAGPAAQVMMFVGIFILVTALPSGWLADRIDRKRLVALSSLIAVLGVGVLLVLADFVFLYVGGSLIGVAMGLFFTANWALGTEMIPQEQAGRYLGLSNLAGAGAGAIGAYIGGPVADQGGYVLLFAIYGALFLVSLLALAGIRAKKAAPGVPAVAA